MSVLIDEISLKTVAHSIVRNDFALFWKRDAFLVLLARYCHVLGVA